MNEEESANVKNLLQVKNPGPDCRDEAFSIDVVGQLSFFYRFLFSVFDWPIRSPNSSKYSEIMVILSTAPSVGRYMPGVRQVPTMQLGLGVSFT